MRIARIIGIGLTAGLCIAGTAKAETQAGHLRIGTSLTQMPWGFFDQNSKPTGVDVAMCGALAKQLGDTPDFVNLDFKGLIPALQADRFDVVCAAMYVTPERQSVIQMVPYIMASQTIIARQNAKLASASDLCGHSASVLQGSGSMKVLQDESEKCKAAGKPEITIQAFDTQPVALRALENSSVDAFIATDSLVSYFMNHNSGYKKIATGISPMQLGIGIPKDNAALAAKVRKGLEAMKADGTYQSILKTWGIESAAVSTF
ncbi:ABC transporter substrate-binding protein [Paraburkholderia phosphatilytica]|uniref:ABC transporter substrate-binding protein n=1 Tax=Paraburkholderia phosphatilytica TaxID=2282883 RepID=UPI000E4FB965|nr:ABC transporter substrate-binding protein [Paraburkholderia phosphatilytica]